jgi:hypothetical protein
VNNSRNFPKASPSDNTVLCDSTLCSLVEFSGVSAGFFLA